MTTSRQIPYAGREPLPGEPTMYCYACGGDGFVEEGPCPACAGVGRVPREAGESMSEQDTYERYTEESLKRICDGAVAILERCLGGLAELRAADPNDDYWHIGTEFVYETCRQAFDEITEKLESGELAQAPQTET